MHAWEPVTGNSHPTANDSSFMFRMVNMHWNRGERLMTPDEWFILPRMGELRSYGIYKLHKVTFSQLINVNAT